MMDKTEQERLAAQHAFEQVGAQMRELATVIAGYYMQLRGEGIPDESAALLAADVQAVFLAIMRYGPPEDR